MGSRRHLGYQEPVVRRYLEPLADHYTGNPDDEANSSIRMRSLDPTESREELKEKADRQKEYMSNLSKPRIMPTYSYVSIKDNQTTPHLHAYPTPLIPKTSTSQKQMVKSQLHQSSGRERATAAELKHRQQK